MGPEAQRLDGRAAVITGAGRGLGLAYARELARRGASILVNDVAVEHADEAVAAITDAGGTAVASYEDVSTPSGGDALVASAVKHFGRLDALINNAAILRNGMFEDLTLGDIESVLLTNLASAFYVTQPAWRWMKENRYGRIVMTSSSTGLLGHGGAANYAASKAGLYGLTKALAFEGQDYGITVNAVLPWATTTIAAGNPVPGHLENWHRLCPEDLAPDDARRSPAMMAHLVAYLASERCVPTGEAYSVCRGRYGRVFVGIAEGWSTEADTASAEAVEAHLDQIRDLSRHNVPKWVFDEVNDVMAGLGAAPGPRA